MCMHACVCVPCELLNDNCEVSLHVTGCWSVIHPQPYTDFTPATVLYFTVLSCPVLTHVLLSVFPV